jgi:hypothetical protein
MSGKEYEAGVGQEAPPMYSPPQGGYPTQQPYGPAAGQPYKQVYQPAPGYASGALQPGMAYQQPMTTVVVTPAVPNPPPDHLIFNIIMTIFCCWPIGIFAIMKSMACRDAAYRGDGQRAEQLSKDAKRLGYWTMGVGIGFIVVTVAITIVIYAVILIPSWNSMSNAYT